MPFTLKHALPIEEPLYVADASAIFANSRDLFRSMPRILHDRKAAA